jgi:ligand-binding sensor domain-containing protein
MDSKIILFLLSFLLSCNQLLPPPKIQEQKVSTKDPSTEKILSVDKFKVGNCSYPQIKKFFISVRELDCPEGEEKDPDYESSIPTKIQGLELDKQDRLYVVDESKGIFLSSDSGKTFDNLTISDVYKYKGVKVSQDVIYVISDTSLHYSSNGGESFVSIEEGLSGLKKIEVSYQKQMNLINGQLFVMLEDYIYLTSNQYIYVYKKDGTLVRKKHITEICKEGFIQDIAVNNDGVLYLATNKEIYISKDNGNSFTLVPFPSGWKEISIASIFYASNGKIYFTSIDGVGELNLDQKSASYILNDDKNPELNFSKFFMDNLQNMYVASNKGIYEKGMSSGFGFFNSTNGLAVDNSTHIKVDSKGNIFVGSQDGLSVSLK